MIRRTLRWLLRTVILAIVLAIVVHVGEWWSHRVASDSVLELDLKGPVIERGSEGLRGLEHLSSAAPAADSDDVKWFWHHF